MKVRRTAYPLASAKCSTIHASQGKTENLVLADLADSMGLSKNAGSMLFYTLVSRVRKLGDIAFLRKFDISLVRQKPSDDLLHYFELLEELAKTTARRVLDSRQLGFNGRGRTLQFYGSSAWTRKHEQEAAKHVANKAFDKRQDPCPCCAATSVTDSG